MGFQDNFPDIPGRIMDQIGLSATFTDVDGGPVSCKVWVDHDVLVQADGYDVGVATVGTTIDALVADVGTPRAGALFVVGTDTWQVQRMDANDGMVIKLVVKRA